jgi:DNA-binding transcriptional ArsR family regulator
MRLSLGPASVSELFEPHAMTLPTLLQHMRVLEISGLIGTKKSGRVRNCEVRPAVLSATEAWLAKQRAVREVRLDSMDACVINVQARGKKHGKRLMTDDVIFMVPGRTVGHLPIWTCPMALYISSLHAMA